jgi:hypothetical protein
LKQWITGKRVRKRGISFIKGGMSFIGIIGMNSRYEAEIQILTQPLDARFQGRIITTSRMDWWLDFKDTR